MNTESQGQGRNGDDRSEMERLRAQLAEVTKERDAYLKALYGMIIKYEPAPEFDEDEVLAQMGKQRPIMDMINELR